VEQKKKSVIKGFRLTDDEADDLSRRATEAGMSESDYLRL
jgi:hypothetical protein